MASGFVGMLEADLRNLSAEARKPEPGFVGYFGGTAHPEVKEAAERALLKLRSLDQDNLNAVTISSCEVLLRQVCADRQTVHSPSIRQIHILLLTLQQT